MDGILESAPIVDDMVVSFPSLENETNE